MLGAGRVLGGSGAFARIQREAGSKMNTPIPGAQPLDEACPGGGNVSSAIGKGAVGESNDEDGLIFADRQS